jgi:RNA polymerase sigma factor (sigma-70 family)
MVLENYFYCDLIVQRLSLNFIQKFPALGSSVVFDAIQDAFESYLNGPTEEIQDDLGQTIGWLWNATKWNLSNYSGKKKRMSSMESMPHKGGDFPSADDAEAQFTITETLNMLMKDLTIGEKDLVNMRKEEITFEEIAKLTGEKRNTIEKRHSRIIARLSKIAKKGDNGTETNL